MRFLLDTNVLSEPARPEPNAGRHAAVRESSRRGLYRLSGVERAPLRLPPSAASSKRREELRGYLRERLEPSLTILPYDAPAADWHAEERARLGRVGRTPAFVDGQIAAVARVNDLVLVTGNVADYQDFEGLVIEDWTHTTG